MKMIDEIITELWKVKDAIANEYGCDMKALVAHLRAKRREEDNPVIDLRSMKQAAEQKMLVRTVNQWVRDSKLCLFHTSRYSRR